MKDLFNHDSESGFITAYGFFHVKSKNNILTELKIYSETKAINLPETPFHLEVQNQVNAYLSGNLTRFDLPVSPEGTPFQKEIWAILQTIPYGATWTYTDLSEVAGDVLKIRAVANANARNPIWVVIPCHRVIGKNGNLRGYAGGMDLKEKLLRLEGILPPSLW